MKSTTTTTTLRGDARGISVLLIAALMIATLANSTVPVNAEPLDRQLTLSGPIGLVPGEGAVFDGRLIHADTGLGLPFHDIEILRDGVAVASATTDEAGLYAAEVAFPDEGVFNLVAHAYADTPLLVASPVWSVSVKDVLELTLSGPTQSEVGQTLTITGSLSLKGNPVASEHVEIRRTGVVVATTTTDNEGMYSAQVEFPDGGISQLVARARVGTPDIVTSQIHTVRVGADIGPFAHVEAGMTGGCGLLFNGTVYCWGNNERGEVGDGTNIMRDHPVMVKNLTDVTSITMGDQIYCAIRSDATAWCWGRNHEGQLGDGTTTNRNTPVQVLGLTDVIDISPDAMHTCAVKGDGTAWCWGYNNHGQLGNGESTLSWEYGSLTPAQVLGPDGEGFLVGVTSISAGWWFTCATTISGTAYCWGQNHLGQGGNGEPTEEDQTTPEQVRGPANFTQISAGHFHACAVSVDGTPYCWGHGASGRLGNGGTSSSSVPTQVLDLLNVTMIDAMHSHSCAIRDNATAWCWGSAFPGKLGNGHGSGHFYTPQLVELGIGAISIGGGAVHTCASAVDGSAWCFGKYSSGSLGNGNSPGPGRFTQNPWPLKVITPTGN